jgi:hypothetical protein
LVEPSAGCKRTAAFFERFLRRVGAFGQAVIEDSSPDWLAF